jgi:hypothetical protein
MSIDTEKQEEYVLPESLKKLYEKKAEWAERFALALFGSLVLGPIVSGLPLTSRQVILGVVATTASYIYANHLLNKTK